MELWRTFNRSYVSWQLKYRHNFYSNAPNKLLFMTPSNYYILFVSGSKLIWIIWCFGVWLCHEHLPILSSILFGEIFLDLQEFFSLSVHGNSIEIEFRICLTKALGKNANRNLEKNAIKIITCSILFHFVQILIWMAFVKIQHALDKIINKILWHFCMCEPNSNWNSLMTAIDNESKI